MVADRDNAPGAILPTQFMDMLEVLDLVADMVSACPKDHVVIKQIMERVPRKDGQLRTKAQARKLLAQAKEYMVTGFQARKTEAQAIYLSRLERLVAKIEPHVVGQITETVMVADIDATGQSSGKKRMKTRMRKDVFNTNAAALLLKYYKEIAILTGGRRADSAINLNANLNQLNIGAEATKAMPTEAMARGLANMLGMEVLDVVPITGQEQAP